MPWWLGFLLPIITAAIEKYGIPWVEKRWPFLVPIIDEILKIIGKKAEPTENLQSAAKHYNMLCSGVACPSPLVKE